MPPFELRHGDAMGRIGTLELHDHERPITTPALLPVINPNIDTLPAADIVEEFDPEGLITNSYVIYRHESLRERALAVGVHGLLDVSCPIMTDSGSFQLAEYGDIEVDNAEIVAFQRDIGSDICTPVDLPTPPDASYETADTELETTLERIEAAPEHLDDDRLLAGPVQGGIHPSLRERAGRAVRETQADIFPIGAVVPLMTEYRFADLVDVVVAAKRGLEVDAPVHLFGAGHPMMFALAAALGCDVLDSAAYALYARDGRYLTVDGTRHLDELEVLPCACPVCAPRTADELAASDTTERLLCRHNLHVSFAEIRRVRQAIRTGRLLELVDRRARSHPAMFDAYRQLLTYTEDLERSDPALKDAFRYLSSECADRPEVARHHDRLRRWSVSGTILIGEGVDDADFDVQLSLRPPFGPVPSGLEHTYPLNAELPERLDLPAYEAAARGVAALAEANPDTTIYLDTTSWPTRALEKLPDTVESLDTVGTDNR